MGQYILCLYIRVYYIIVATFIYEYRERGYYDFLMWRHCEYYHDRTLQQIKLIVLHYLLEGIFSDFAQLFLLNFV